MDNNHGSFLHFLDTRYTHHIGGYQLSLSLRCVNTPLKYGKNRAYLGFQWVSGRFCPRPVPQPFPCSPKRVTYYKAGCAGFFSPCSCRPRPLLETWRKTRTRNAFPNSMGSLRRCPIRYRQGITGNVTKVRDGDTIAPPHGMLGTATYSQNWG
mgnify:CR=1 FL=1|jgi:hypothetical protein